MTLGLGVDPGLTIMRQQPETREFAPDRTSLAGSSGAEASAKVDLARGLYVGVEAAAQTCFFEQPRVESKEGQLVPSGWPRGSG